MNLKGMQQVPNVKYVELSLNFLQRVNQLWKIIQIVKNISLKLKKWKPHCLPNQLNKVQIVRGGSGDFERDGGWGKWGGEGGRGGGLYVGYHGWSTNKMLGFRWSKKAKHFFSIFKFSPFLHLIKAWWWNFISFSRYTNAFIRKKSHKEVNEKKKLRKVEICFI